jgi:hypothetical protein
MEAKMSKAKFTPGPWKVNVGFRTYDGSFAVTAPDSDIAFVTFHGKAKRGEAWHTDDPEGLANANLIAAATELYEALELGLRLLENMTSDDFSKGADKPFRDAARAALAKADSQ